MRPVSRETPVALPEGDSQTPAEVEREGEPAEALPEPPSPQPAEAAEAETAAEEAAPETPEQLAARVSETPLTHTPLKPEFEARVNEIRDEINRLAKRMNPNVQVDVVERLFHEGPELVASGAATPANGRKLPVSTGAHAV